MFQSVDDVIDRLAKQKYICNRNIIQLYKVIDRIVP